MPVVRTKGHHRRRWRRRGPVTPKAEPAPQHPERQGLRRRAPEERYQDKPVQPARRRDPVERWGVRMRETRGRSKCEAEGRCFQR